MFIIDFLNLNLGAYLIFWAKNTVENVSGPFGAGGGAYEIGKTWVGFRGFGLILVWDMSGVGYFNLGYFLVWVDFRLG